MVVIGILLFASGDVVSLKTLPDGKYEAVFFMDRVLLKVSPLKNCGTCILSHRSTGPGMALEAVINLEGQNHDGTFLAWKGERLCKDGSKFPAMNWAVMGQFSCVCGKFSHVADTICLPVFSILEDLTYKWECIDWGTREKW